MAHPQRKGADSVDDPYFLENTELLLVHPGLFSISKN